MNDSNRFERENNRKNTGGKMKIQHWKVIAIGLMVYDVIAIAFSYFFGLWLRFDFQFTNIPTEYLHSYVRFIPFYIIASILFFWFMRMYRGIWRFAGFNELLRYSSASLIASVAHAAVITLVCRRMPFSYYIVGAVIQLILVVGIRFSYLMALTTYGNYEIEDLADFVVYIPKADPHFLASLAVIPLQLIGYYVSVAKGLDVDKPRNLAKSVTVE